jgi:syndecan 1
MRRPTAWLELLPLQRASGSDARVIDADGFSAGLAAWADPSFLQPLGHTVDRDGPAGLAHGLLAPLPEAQVLEGSTSGLPVLHSRRGAARAHAPTEPGLIGAGGTEVAPAEPQAGISTSTVDSVAAASQPATPGVQRPTVVAPAVQRRVEQASFPAPPSAIPDVDAGAGPLAPVTAVHNPILAAEAGESPTAAVEESVTTVPTLEQPVPDGGPATTPVPLAAADSALVHPGRPVPSATTGVKPGLGSPLPEPSTSGPSPAVQRRPEASSTSARQITGTARIAQRTLAAPAPSSASVVLPAAPPGPLPLVQRASEALPAMGPSADSTPTSPAELPSASPQLSSRAPDVQIREVVPLLPGQIPAAGLSSTVEPEGIRTELRWSAPALPGGGLTAHRPMEVQRIESTPETPGRAAPVVGSKHPLPSVSRLPDLPPMPSATSARQSGEAPAASAPNDPGEVAVARGLAQREADGSVVFRLAEDHPPAKAPGTDSQGGGLGGPTVQAVGETTSPAASAAPAAGVPSGQDIEALAQRLMPHVGRYLRDELRHDRERRGRTADLRH